MSQPQTPSNSSPNTSHTTPQPTTVNIQLGPDGRPVKKNLKELSKQERRAYQEAQRLAKKSSTQTASVDPTRSTTSSHTPATQAASRPVSAGNHAVLADTAAVVAGISALTLPTFTKPMALFSHLPTPLHERKLEGFSAHGSSPSLHYKHLHPAIVQLGLHLSNGDLHDPNTRARAMLDSFKILISDYSTPPDAVLSRHLTQTLGLHITYLSDIRPLNTGMGSAIRQLKHDISVLSPDMPDIDAKNHLLGRIDTFIRERITVASTVIAEKASKKIKQGDVILTFSNSSAVQEVLLTTHASGSKFRVVVIDARPGLEGRALTHELLKHGVPTTYALISGLGYAIREATKVLLGANGMLSNGGLLANIGSAQVAMMAARNNIPVIVACETYKFSGMILLDSIVFNELGDPSDLQTEIGAKDLHANNKALCKGLNLLFDVTPPEFLTVIVTELGLIPAESVPVVLREHKPMLEST